VVTVVTDAAGAPEIFSGAGLPRQVLIRTPSPSVTTVTTVTGKVRRWRLVTVVTDFRGFRGPFQTDYLNQPGPRKTRAGHEQVCATCETTNSSDHVSQKPTSACAAGSDAHEATRRCNDAYDRECVRARPLSAIVVRQSPRSSRLVRFNPAHGLGPILGPACRMLDKFN
jgi:hypothetical protein